MKLEDKLQIHELLGRAAHGYDERQVDMLEACFAEDAVMAIRIAGGDLIGPFRGRAGIMKLMSDSMAAQTDKRRHVISNLFFVEEGADKAKLSSNLSLFAVENGAARLITTGVYTDEVGRRNGTWQILNRHLDLDAGY